MRPCLPVRASVSPRPCVRVSPSVRGGPCQSVSVRVSPCISVCPWSVAAVRVSVAVSGDRRRSRWKLRRASLRGTPAQPGLLRLDPTCDLPYIQAIAGPAPAARAEVKGCRVISCYTTMVSGFPQMIHEAIPYGPLRRFPFLYGSVQTLVRRPWLISLTTGQFKSISAI